MQGTLGRWRAELSHQGQHRLGKGWDKAQRRRRCWRDGGGATALPKGKEPHGGCCLRRQTLK